MKQISFSQAEFQRKKRRTRREVFLDEMEQVMPWAELFAVVEPHYPKGKRGRPPVGLERMLRMYFVQQWNGLSDEGVEDAITDSQALQRFVGIDLSREAAPDASTVLQFRHLLEQHGLAKKLLEAVNTVLAAAGLMMREGTIADATIIAAPPSVMNQANARDPDMHQTKKGNQWYFGMKAHIGVDAESGLVHTVVGTSANEADVTQTEHLLHGEEKDVFLDAGYVDADKREELKDRDVNWEIAMKRGKRKAVSEESGFGQLLRKLESLKASIRSKVEHPFHIVKNLFHYKKVRYKGLDKNTAQLHTLFALANLMIAKRKLLALDGQVAS
ncbi:MAG: Transposase DDE domain protein [Candidatus Accumulibacter regalis]|jgi:IS5 family transposase|uniref:Transposase DDE domain protein n=2 Tax=Candidatus Accumulibacter TaxID=327159 RepID=A0A011Q354_ACCRE|nr:MULTISPECIES: IS5 family transposase [unclassified Candidatus Accumulibacter]EXI77471.1 MAG: Transposase DDE domain protein [Candidatus Accumulibacter appositus]EXI83565.1 MAG: Transposase DDE domain protein [Candidatus Accumulibacter regalis]HRE73011.1 IS5 family transposase [Accumulibacter sp.]